MVDFTPVGQRVAHNQTPDLVSELKTKLDYQEKKTNQAVKFRRYQRWFFYISLVIVFIIGLLYIIKIYRDNNKLLTDISNINLVLDKNKANLDRVVTDLSTKDRALQVADASLKEVQAELLEKTEDLNEVADKIKILQNELDKAKIDLGYSSSNVSNIILEVAVRLDKNILQKIPLADVEPDTLDSDGDGLADDLELAINTDISKSDSDEDGYTDKEEVIGGFNPLGSGDLGVDNKIADKYKKQIILQDNNFAWYVGDNGKKYFLGNIENNFATMRLNKYWSRKN